MQEHQIITHHCAPNVGNANSKVLLGKQTGLQHNHVLAAAATATATSSGTNTPNKEDMTANAHVQRTCIYCSMGWMVILYPKL
jgi:hypothetical protein